MHHNQNNLFKKWIIIRLLFRRLSCTCFKTKNKDLNYSVCFTICPVVFVSVALHFAHGHVYVSSTTSDAFRHTWRLVFSLYAFGVLMHHVYRRRLYFKNGVDGLQFAHVENSTRNVSIAHTCFLQQKHRMHCIVSAPS